MRVSDAVRHVSAFGPMPKRRLVDDTSHHSPWSWTARAFPVFTWCLWAGAAGDILAAAGQLDRAGRRRRAGGGAFCDGDARSFRRGRRHRQAGTVSRRLRGTLFIYLNLAVRSLLQIQVPWNCAIFTKRGLFTIEEMQYGPRRRTK